MLLNTFLTILIGRNWAKAQSTNNGLQLPTVTVGLAQVADTTDGCITQQRSSKSQQDVAHGMLGPDVINLVQLVSSSGPERSILAVFLTATTSLKITATPVIIPLGADRASAKVEEAMPSANVISAIPLKSHSMGSKSTEPALVAASSSITLKEMGAPTQTGMATTQASGMPALPLQWGLSPTPLQSTEAAGITIEKTALRWANTSQQPTPLPSHGSSAIAGSSSSLEASLPAPASTTRSLSSAPTATEIVTSSTTTSLRATGTSAANKISSTSQNEPKPTPQSTGNSSGQTSAVAITSTVQDSSSSVGHSSESTTSAISVDTSYIFTSTVQSVVISIPVINVVTSTVSELGAGTDITVTMMSIITSRLTTTVLPVALSATTLTRQMTQITSGHYHDSGVSSQTGLATTTMMTTAANAEHDHTSHASPQLLAGLGVTAVIIFALTLAAAFLFMRRYRRKQAIKRQAVTPDYHDQYEMEPTIPEVRLGEDPPASPKSRPLVLGGGRPSSRSEASWGVLREYEDPWRVGLYRDEGCGSLRSNDSRGDLGMGSNERGRQARGAKKHSRRPGSSAIGVAM